MLIGVAASTLVTTVIQSSGARSACASRSSWRRLQEPGPGLSDRPRRHIGTCTTPCSPRSAPTSTPPGRAGPLGLQRVRRDRGHRGQPFFLWLIPLTSHGLVHQTANLHTVVMLTGALLVLLSAALRRFITVILRTNKPCRSDHLDPHLITFPNGPFTPPSRTSARHQDLHAKLPPTIDLLFQIDPHKVKQVKLNEDVVDEIKRSMKDYLAPSRSASCPGGRPSSSSTSAVHGRHRAHRRPHRRALRHLHPARKISYADSIGRRSNCSSRCTRPRTGSSTW